MFELQNDSSIYERNLILVRILSRFKYVQIRRVGNTAREFVRYLRSAVSCLIDTRK